MGFLSVLFVSDLMLEYVTPDTKRDKKIFDSSDNGLALSDKLVNVVACLIVLEAVPAIFSREGTVSPNVTTLCTPFIALINESP